MKKIILILALIMGTSTITYSQSASLPSTSLTDDSVVVLSQDEAKRVFTALGELKALRDLLELYKYNTIEKDAIIEKQQKIMADMETIINAQKATIEEYKKLTCEETRIFFIYRKKVCY